MTGKPLCRQLRSTSTSRDTCRHITLRIQQRICYAAARQHTIDHRSKCIGQKSGTQIKALKYDKSFDKLYMI